MRWHLAILTGLTSALVLLLSQANAGLGDVVGELSGHAAPIAGHTKVLSENDNYRVIETSGKFNSVREYVAAGKVFAVAWSGKTQPDLGKMLGDSFSQFSEAQKAKSGPRVLGRQAYNSISTGDLVVERFGRFGAMGGKAYLKSQMPSGMSADAIK